MPDTQGQQVPRACAPRRLGTYRLIEELGEGSFGRVFCAEDERLHRLVALKVLKPDARLRQIQGQFRVEQAALGRMNSVYIAKLYDTGEVDGHLYFALEYVEGQAITTFCATANLPLSERLELFCRLCAGVQHAHQRGVIHRDLKPTNVLVSSADGRPVPKIIDFGLARGHDRFLVDDQLPTLPGTVLGTLVYMSPEQARGTAVDTRTDVHALGVILYELLSGLLPIDMAELRNLGPVQALARVLQPVQRPSACLARLMTDDPQRADAIAAERQVTAPQLLGALIGDLDWIVLRATAEEPDKRYETPSALAEDVRRYLQHMPVTARPPSRAYRVRKFVRRHRWPVLLAGALCLLLVTVTGGALIAMRQAEENARLAGDNEHLARARAVEAAAREQANAKALFQSGDFARRRGDYATALDLFERAEQGGLAEPVELWIRRVEALDGARRYAEAAEALATLTDRQDLGRRRAKVCLLEADLGVDRLRDPDHNLDRAQEALRLCQAEPGCLEPADELYARALVDDDPGQVLALLRRAREADPYHRRVNDCFGVTLLLHGRVDEARTFGQVLHSLYPDDPQVAFFALCIAGLDGDQDAADHLIAQVKARFGDQEARYARLIWRACSVKSWGNEVLRKLSLGNLERKELAWVLLQLFGRIMPIWREVQDAAPEGTRATLGEAFFRIPPAMVRVFRPIWLAARGSDGKPISIPRLIDALQATSEHAIEGTVPYLQATALAVTYQDARAAEMLRRALRLPSGIIERRTMLIPALTIGSAFVLEHTLDADAEAALRRDMLAWIAEAAARTDLDADELHVVHAAADLIGSDRLLAVVAAWNRVAPDDARARLALADWLLHHDAAEAARRAAHAVELETDAADWLRRWRSRILTQTGK